MILILYWSSKEGSGLGTDRLVENVDWERTELMSLFCSADNYRFYQSYSVTDQAQSKIEPVMMDKDIQWSHYFQKIWERISKWPVTMYLSCASLNIWIEEFWLRLVIVIQPIDKQTECSRSKNCYTQKPIFSLILLFYHFLFSYFPFFRYLITSFLFSLS